MKGLTFKLMDPAERFDPNFHHTDIFITSLLHHCHKTFIMPLHTAHMPRFLCTLLLWLTVHLSETEDAEGVSYAL